MDVLDRFQVLDAHQFADGALFDQLFHFDEIGRIAQHVAHRHDLPGLAGHGQDVAALLFGLRHWFFEQHIVPHLHGLQAGLVVQVVGHGDDDGVGEFGPFEDILPGLKPVLFRDPVLFGVPFVADGDGFGHTHNVDLFGEVHGIVAIDVAARSGAAGDGGEGPAQRVVDWQVDVAVV